MPVDPVKIQLAETEAELLQSIHKGILDGCQKKCFVPYYTESELSKGENACVDRCTSKFYKANLIIGQHMKDLGVQPEDVTAPSLIKASLGQHSTLSE